MNYYCSSSLNIPEPGNIVRSCNFFENPEIFPEKYDELSLHDGFYFLNNFYLNLSSKTYREHATRTHPYKPLECFNTGLKVYHSKKRLRQSIVEFFEELDQKIKEQGLEKKISCQTLSNDDLWALYLELRLENGYRHLDLIQ